MRRLVWSLVVVVVVVGAFVGVTLLSPSLPSWWPWDGHTPSWWPWGGDTNATQTSSTTPLNFQAAEIRDMQAVTTLSGTLGYPQGDQIVSRLTGTITGVAEAGSTVSEGGTLFEVDGSPVTLLVGSYPATRDLGPSQVAVPAGLGGIVTEVPTEDEVIDFNQQLFRVNDQPVILLQGGTPAWRSMRRNTEGVDVLELETALTAMGYDPNGSMTIDDTFSAATQTVVEAWQTDVGLPVDGRVDLGEVVFLPQPVTVKSVSAQVGSSVGSATPVVSVLPGFTTIQGPDVVELQQGLARLDYDVTASGVFDDATQAAVRSWQESIGAPVDGVVDLGEVIFLPGPVRVTDSLVDIGGAARDGTAVLDTSGDTSLVSLDLPANQQDLIAVGDQVSVVLPDNTEVPGTVTSISGIATRAGGGDITFATTIDVGALDTTLDQAPVDVDVVTDSRPQVLAVPVTALLALAEGGYAVEVGDASATHLVEVTPGLYADGWVQVDSAGLHAGDMVVVP
jgi:peptidoglycan hydrolase-like protein with peptidoglycan-binding domain